MTGIGSYELNDGNSLPVVGFGTFPLRDEDGAAVMRAALESGYRLLDSAVNYGNEEAVGQAVRASSVAREDVRITTKVPGRHHEHSLAVKSVEESLRKMGTDYLDLCLIHWPNPSVGRYVEAWRALIDLRERGLARSIGVSNFTEQHLRAIIDDSGVTPAVNQLELHPYFPQAAMRQVNAELGIQTQSWSPLGERSVPFAERPVAEAAAAHGVTPAQVILRWQLQLGALPIPKSADPQRQRENLDLFGFELTDAEVVAISGLARDDGRLFGGDPDVHEEM
ncbi:diketogulonate reductase-like aldo/keto reductase [Halopolyspora algeriensis]|uniref:Diketogulonate reductase-like aldo/keto reductase n=1 Tax=Halopolyspora algeriensis TaxID=1500506 RepID=A0A368VIM3_9ACTN|nr:aldo/keto reductase [Halopolyspora algeriensis]RCW41061.1 diketogulonate reductase-like aldo/keto reductase [Halopolyspora algeriensis]TQM53855.1 diketogulonate reductase-like aldo/keto reductase [Halopolyspora algeriensis]